MTLHEFLDCDYGADGGGRLDEARQLLAEHPGGARTGNPEEDRLLDAGSSLHYPNQPDSNAYAKRLCNDASLAVRPLLARSR